MTDQVYLSFVVPCYNEGENIEALYRDVVRACESKNIYDFEIVYVENGSWDVSHEIMTKLSLQDARVQIVQLSRNFGYQGAIAAGIEFASGQWVSILDGDLQDPPALIPLMLERAGSRYDVVYGVRKKRAEGLRLRFFYQLFYLIWRWTAEVKIPMNSGEFCVMNRRVIEVIRHMPERQRFNRGLRAWAGFRQCGFEYDRVGRATGETKFSFMSSLNLAFDGIFAYSVVPLRIMLLAGIVLTTVAVTISLTNTLFWIFHQFGFNTHTGLMPLGLTQLNLVFSVILGFIVICLGIIGEYIGRIYNEVKQRPVYVVRSLTGAHLGIQNRAYVEPVGGSPSIANEDFPVPIP